MFVKFSGKMKYLYSMMDDETRFWIAQEAAHTKQRHNARGFFYRSMKAGGKVPSTRITDGSNSYRVAFNNLYKWRKDSQPVHVREITLKGIQIYHNSIRPHQSLNDDTPADREGIKVEGPSNWRTIIEDATYGTHPKDQNHE